MPTYLYRCDTGHVTDLFQSFDEDKRTTCPADGCDAPAHRLLGRPRFIGFLGKQSISPKMEEFWNTGDPEVFAKPGGTA